MTVALRIALLALGLLALGACHRYRSEADILAADHFSVDGLYAGMSEGEFTRLCTVTENDAGPVQGTRFCMGSTAHVLSVMAVVTEQRLALIQCFYLPDTVQAEGGWKTYYSRLNTRLGSPDRVERLKDDNGAPRTNYVWEYPRLHRTIDMTVGSGGVSIDQRDTEVSRPNVGF